MRPLTVDDVAHVAHYAASIFMTWDEPIPDFDTRYPGILEGCLANAFQTYGGKDLYKSLVDKAAIIFYTMIKDHPFMNGNKRIAVTSLLVFLALNGKWLKASNEAMYEMAIDIAASKARLKDGYLAETAKFIRINLVPLA